MNILSCLFCCRQKQYVNIIFRDKVNAIISLIERQWQVYTVMNYSSVIFSYLFSHSIRWCSMTSASLRKRLHPINSFYDYDNSYDIFDTIRILISQKQSLLSFITFEMNCLLNQNPIRSTQCDIFHLVTFFSCTVMIKTLNK